jgi:large subunit ribosomal protein L6
MNSRFFEKNQMSETFAALAMKKESFSQAKHTHMFLQETLKIPVGITLKSVGQLIKIEGPLGIVVCDLGRLDSSGAGFLRLTQDEIHFIVRQTSVKARPIAWLGSMVSFFQKQFEGVSQGYLITLECIGVGYRVNVMEKSGASSSQSLELKLGQTHDLFYELPPNIRAFSLKPSIFCLYGINAQEITQVAADLRQLKPPEPYKGKGIRRKDEVIRLREGKKK